MKIHLHNPEVPARINNVIYNIRESLVVSTYEYKGVTALVLCLGYEGTLARPGYFLELRWYAEHGNRADGGPQQWGVACDIPPGPECWRRPTSWEMVAILSDFQHAVDTEMNP